MANMDRENMAVDIRKRVKKRLMKRFVALSDWEQQAMGALMEAGGYSIDQALAIVEVGEFEFYPGITSLADLAYRFVHGGAWGDPGILEKIGPYINIDYDKIALDLYEDGYRKTSSGIVRLW